MNRENLHRRFRHRSCVTKVRYRDRAEAVLALQKAKRRRGTPLRIYECELCLGYHLTSKEAT